MEAFIELILASALLVGLLWLAKLI